MPAFLGREHSTRPSPAGDRSQIWQEIMRAFLIVKRTSPKGVRFGCVCFGRGPSNHQGRRGEGGDPGVKSKGGGHSLWGFVHGFLGLPAKKTRRWPAGNGSLYVRDSASPKGELCVFWSGPLQPSRKTGGGGRSGREEQGWGAFLRGVRAWIPRASPQKKLGDGRRGTAPCMCGIRRARRASCVCFGRGPSNHQGRRGEGGDPGVKSKGGGHSLWGVVHGFLGRPRKKN